MCEGSPQEINRVSRLIGELSELMTSFASALANAASIATRIMIVRDELGKINKNYPNGEKWLQSSTYASASLVVELLRPKSTQACIEP